MKDNKYLKVTLKIDNIPQTLGYIEIDAEFDNDLTSWKAYKRSAIDYAKDLGVDIKLSFEAIDGIEYYLECLNKDIVRKIASPSKLLFAVKSTLSALQAKQKDKELKPKDELNV